MLPDANETDIAICEHVLEGLKPMSRQYVHLSGDIETASKVGERHGNLYIINIDAEQMYKDGYKFYLSDNGVYLTKSVPVKYFKN